MAEDPFRAELYEEKALAEELELRRRAGPARWPVAVTDLLDPRPAFFRRQARVPLPPDRARRRSEGSEWHLRWARQAAPLRALEVRVVRDGMVGVVDVLGPDGPLELKTTGRPVPVARLLEERGSYLDQLGLYCALTDLPEGGLVVVGDPVPDATRPVVAARGRFRDLGDLRRDAAARAERFRRALRAGDAAELPRCLWFGRECPYQLGKVCGCQGGEPRDDAWVRERLTKLEEDPSTEALWRAAIQRADAAPPPVVRAFRDLSYPRRAYFERTEPGTPGEELPPDPLRDAAFRELTGSVESGPPGERGQMPVPSGEPLGSAPTFRGRPFLAKVSRAAPPPSPLGEGSLPETYRTELGLRVAALDLDEGWVFVHYLRSVPGSNPIRAVRLRYLDRAALQGELARRRHGLEAALAAGEGRLAPACPGWRWESCPYRARCGCGEASPGA